MVAVTTADTINNVADPLTAILPVKSRTISTCSVATEQGVFESRDAAAVGNRGEDSARDGAADDSIAVAETNQISAPLESAARSSPSSYEGLLVIKDSSSVASHGCSSSSIPFLTRAGDHIDAVIQNFYSSLEVGAEKVVASCACSSKESGPPGTDSAPDTSDLAPDTADLLAASESTDTKEGTPEPTKKEDRQGPPTTQQASVKTAKSQDSIKPASIKTQGTTTKSIKTQGTNKSINSTQNGTQKHQQPYKPQSSCCFMSVFPCSGGDQCQGENELQDASVEVEVEAVPPTPLSLDEIIGDTLNITSSKVHILDTFSDDNTYGSATPRPVDFVTPRAQCLLEEIEDIENSLFEVRKTASEEKVREIKKRQDPFIQKMATIKQQLLDQQTLLESAPEDTKKDYYRAISHAAMLNAEVETRRAELELKKIRLESMKVEEEMDRMMVMDDSLDETLDSLDQSLTTRESDEGAQRAFDVFARYTASKFHKMRRNKNRGRTAAE
eukprot:CAMPEP_0172526130 /NCGR_PEP_ID=MMETSP1067-20121228/1115_1 /TAXON_ID=265564 ORGANISM="Thalassiosira punctigera, Strain Tpunct2005C2" /NCGR_SAMPLE_ID=MMETSP1067 /ASSEMBLY_ACC=CAM_ASM_000444 /LENGTH=499 /DNA_ID=CAMNT_0013309573 /DNA_START=85 /DNA_END=1584 /DNA_ORIENTATION=-